MLSVGSLEPPDAILEAIGSFGGGGKGDLVFVEALGGGASARGLGFPFPERAAESIPVPLVVGLGFTLILMVSPSFKPNHKKTFFLASTELARD